MRRFKRRSKRTRKYKSKLEAKVARSLGKRATYETQVINYLLPKRYTPDFVYHDAVGNVVFIEVKGWFRSEDQQKMKAVKQSNPELDIRMFFPQDNKVQGSKMKNSEWCDKYGFPYALERIPKEWLT